MRVASHARIPAPLTVLQLFCFAFLLLAATVASAAPGTLLGKVLTGIPGGDDYLRRAVVQPDGKIVVAGAARFGTMQYEITRYNADGTLDTTFGTQGTVLEPLGPGDGEAWALAVQSDGKIVVAGHVRSDRDRFGLARFNADGSLDTSFGGGGVATAVGPGDSGGYAMAIQPDGKIVLGGYSIGPSGKKVFTLVRYNKDTTTLDTTFGTNGVAVTGEAVGDEVIRGLGLQSDGKIVAAGSGSNYLAVHRFNTDGSLDLAWGTGSVSNIIGGADVVVLPDDRVAIAGTVPDGAISDLGVLLMTANGNPDSTFGSGQCPSGACAGIAYMTAAEDPSGYGLVVQSDGKLVIVGTTDFPARPGSGIAIGRFNTDGSIDATFGTNGRTVIQPASDYDSGWGVALRPNGGFIVAGQANGNHGDWDSLAVAFTSAGALDTSFNGTGFSQLDRGKVGGQALDAVLQPDGKVVVAGTVTPENHTVNPTPTYGALVRYSPDGSLDSTFGSGGVVNVNWATKAIALQGTQIVAAGFSGTAMAFGRFNADGSVDTNFGTAGLTTFPLSGDQEFINDIAIQGDGSIVGAGVIDHNGTFSDSAIARVTSTGAIDTSFGGSGKVVAAMSTGNDEANGIAIQSDGKIVAVGWGDVSGSQDSFTAIRVNGDGSIDGSFGASGIATIDFGANSSFARAVAIQPDGKIVLGGKVFSPTSSTDDFALARLATDGTLDDTFGTGGMTSSDFGNHNRVNALALLASGKIVGAGEDGGLFAVVQYLPDGTLDTAFGTGGNTEFQENAGNDYANAIVVGADGTLYLAGNGSGLFGVAAVSGDASSPPPPPTPTVSVSSSANPSTTGQSVTFTANVTGSAGTPTGTVQFDDGGSPISGCASVALSGGSATCATSALTQGSHSITAVYFGDGTYTAASSSALTQTVNAPVMATPTVSIASSKNPSTDGDNVTFTATVTGSSGTPTGTATFMDGATTLCASVALSSGAATCATATLSVGTHSITASYSGDGSYDAATSSAVSQVVQSASSGGPSVNAAAASAGATATASSTLSTRYPVSAIINGDRTGAGFGSGGIWEDANAYAFPDWVQIQFNGAQTIDHVIVYSMQDDYSRPIEPTDTMTFRSYGVTAFDVQAWNGSAWVTVGSVTGNDLVKRTVSFAQVTTDRIRIVIDNALNGYSRLAEVEAWTVAGSGGTTPVDATIALSSSLNPSTQGQSVTFTAQLSGSAGTPTGTVSFLDGGGAISGCSSVALSGGNATCATSALAQGTHSITASYSGDTSYNAGTSSALTQTVNPASSGLATPTVAVASSVNPSQVGDAVTFTANVSGSSGTPTGTVSFMDGASAICSSVALSSGQATCVTSSLAAGNHAITVSYGGDASYNHGTSAALTQTVQSGSGGGTSANVAAASAGATVTASSTLSTRYPTSAVNNGDRTGAGFGNGGIWEDANAYAFPDWVQIQFNGAQTIDHVIVYSMQDNYSQPVEPTDTMTFLRYGVTAFDVQAWNGSAWVTVGSVTGNNLVKRTVSFAQVTTDRIRIVINNALNGYSRIAEIEAWSAGGSGGGGGLANATINVASSANPSTFADAVTFTANVSGSAGTPSGTVGFLDGGSAIAGCSAVTLSSGSATCTTSSLSVGTHSITVSYSGDASYNAGVSASLSQVVQSASGGGGGDVNVAAASAGATASASSTLSTRYPVSAIIDGDRTGAGFGSGGIWEDANAYTFPDWVQVQFAGTKTIDHVSVYSMQDDYMQPVDPSDTMTFQRYGVTGFMVQGWDGSQWVTLGTAAGNDLVKRTVTFPAFTTDRVRVVVTNALNGYSRLAEVEVFGH